MRKYLKSRVGETLLMALASACLLLNFSQGFYIPETVANSVPLALGICLVLSFLFYLGGYNRGTAAALAALLFAGMAALFLYLRSRGVDIVDTEDSGTAVYIYVFAALVIPLLAFLLSRPLPGIAVLEVLGALLAGLVDYLGYPAHTWANLLFCASTLCLFMLRANRKTAADPASRGNGGFLPAALLTAGASAALAVAVFLTVIRPLNPPTLDIELISRYLRYPIFEAAGIARNYPIPDELLRQEDPEPDEINSGEPDETPDEELPEETEVPPEETEGELAAMENGSSAERTEALGSVTYGPSLTRTILLALLAAVLFIAAAIGAAAALRKRRLERLRALPPGQQIVELYRFYLQKFGSIGFRRPAAQTAGEYLAFNEERLAPYTEGTLSLSELTGTFQAVRYGGEEPDPSQCARFLGFYPAFLKNYRRLHGPLKYALRRVSFRKTRRI